MRKLVVLLILTFCLIAGVSRVSSQTFNSVPTFPSDYLQWENKFERSVKVDGQTTLEFKFFVRQYRGERPKSLGLWVVNGEVVSVEFLQGRFGGHGLDGVWEIQFWVGQGYIIFKADSDSSSLESMAPTDEAIETVSRIFESNVKNKFGFDFTKEAEKLEASFAAEIEEFSEKIEEIEKPTTP